MENIPILKDMSNCIVAGVGGVPGILLLLICQYFFHV